MTCQWPTHPLAQMLALLASPFLVTQRSLLWQWEIVTGVISPSDDLSIFSPTILREKILKFAHTVRSWIFRIPPLGKSSLEKNSQGEGKCLLQNSVSRRTFPGPPRERNRSSSFQGRKFLWSNQARDNGLSKVKCFVVSLHTPPPRFHAPLLRIFNLLMAIANFQSW